MDCLEQTDIQGYICCEYIISDLVIKKKVPKTEMFLSVSILKLFQHAHVDKRRTAHFQMSNATQIFVD